jgi:D-lactate dehydrogenase (cytochrome)
VASDAEVLGAYLEDAAHYAGGFAVGVAHPRTEGEVAALVRAHPRLLPIGAQSSVTGGATPKGEVVVSTARMAAVAELGGDRARVEPGLTLTAFQEALAAAGAYYPPAPTYTGAFAGGVVATNASGAATFKYGSTRDWVEALTVVLASGEVLDLVRREVVAHPDGWFEIEDARGVTRVPVPRYRMPTVSKRSAGYFAAPGMDLVDLFIGAEGTLGIITSITFRLLPRVPLVALALIPVTTETAAVDLVAALRDVSLRTWRDHDPRGIDVAAVETMDRRCLEILREDGADQQHDVALPRGVEMVLLAQIELPTGTTAAQAYDEIGSALDAGVPDTPLVRLCRLFDAHGVLDATELVMPGDARRAGQLLAVREAVPTGVNHRIAEATRVTGQQIEKAAADMVVPFEHFGDMLAVYHDGYRRRGLDYAIWGHISDGNVHPNVIPRTVADVRGGQDAILEFGRAAARLGGCPLAEHGVGRSPVKQALLRQLYGDSGIENMRAVKRALDPQGKLAPGVVFEWRG